MTHAACSVFFEATVLFEELTEINSKFPSSTALKNLFAFAFTLFAFDVKQYKKETCLMTGLCW